MNDVTESDYYDFMAFDHENARSVLSHYVPMFTEGPVLELACGPGVFLTLLAEQGVKATGVDLDEGMVETARAHGHEIVLADALAHLRDLPAESLSGLFAAHFLEHLTAPDVQAVYEQAFRVLRPGGTFVAVVPNAACLSVLGYDFWRDPTHVRFYDPVLLRFFGQRCGFDTVASGGNPRNHPGPPPDLFPPGIEHLSSLSADLEILTQHAQQAEIDTLTGIEGRLARSVPNSAALRDSSSRQTALWAELGHLVSQLDQRVQQVNHAQAGLTDAYRALLDRLYPSNEVFVAVRKPVREPAE